MGAAEDLQKAIADGVAAELARIDKEAKAKQDPTTLAELMDRLSDQTVDKLLAKLAEGDEIDPATAKPKTGEGGPVEEHALFRPLFGGGKKTA